MKNKSTPLKTIAFSCDCFGQRDVMYNRYSFVNSNNISSESTAFHWTTYFFQFPEPILKNGRQTYTIIVFYLGVKIYKRSSQLLCHLLPTVFELQAQHCFAISKSKSSISGLRLESVALPYQRASHP